MFWRFLVLIVFIVGYTPAFDFVRGIIGRLYFTIAYFGVLAILASYADVYVKIKKSKSRRKRRS